MGPAGRGVRYGGAGRSVSARAARGVGGISAGATGTTTTSRLVAAALDAEYRVTSVQGKGSSLSLRSTLLKNAGAEGVSGGVDSRVDDGVGGSSDDVGNQKYQHQQQQQQQQPQQQQQRQRVGGGVKRRSTTDDTTIEFAPATDPALFTGNVHRFCPHPASAGLSSSSTSSSSSSPPPGNLIFDAAFESGNLGRVDCLSPAEYNLHIRPDLASPRHRLWFYFRVWNAAPAQHVMFSIINFSKSRSLFGEGMAPVVRSKKRPAWRRMDPADVFQYKPDAAAKKGGAVVSFAFHFDDPQDVYEFAYSFPYTYTHSQRKIAQWKLRHRSFLQLRSIGSSVQGRNLDMLTITAPKNFIKMKKGERFPTIFITARVHPGETPASFVCQGVVQYLLSQHVDAIALRSRVVVHVIPMLNPDGVFHGTYRGNTLGFDLNRCWDKAVPSKHPTISAIRTLLTQHMKAATRVLAFVDLHGHSTALSSFIYGNEYADSTRMQAQWSLPRVLANVSDMFSLARTKFNSDARKAGTGRRWIGSLLGAEGHSFTLETSFYGFAPDYSTQTIPFEVEDYTTLGAHVVQALAKCYLSTLDDDEEEECDDGGDASRGRGPTRTQHQYHHFQPQQQHMHRGGGGDGGQRRGGGVRRVPGGFDVDDDDDDDDGANGDAGTGRRSTSTSARSRTHTTHHHHQRVGRGNSGRGRTSPLLQLRGHIGPATSAHFPTPNFGGNLDDWI